MRHPFNHTFMQSVSHAICPEGAPAEKSPRLTADAFNRAGNIQSPTSNLQLDPFMVNLALGHWI